MFFASTESFIKAFENVEDKKIQIDFTNSNLWDESAVGSVLKVARKLEDKGTTVEIIGLNASSQKLYNILLGLSPNH